MGKEEKIVRKKPNPNPESRLKSNSATPRGIMEKLIKIKKQWIVISAAEKPEKKPSECQDQGVFFFVPLISLPFILSSIC